MGYWNSKEGGNNADKINISKLDMIISNEHCIWFSVVCLGFVLFCFVFCFVFCLFGFLICKRLV